MLLGFGLSAYLWYKQYGRAYGLCALGMPKVDYGLPVLGHISFLWKGWLATNQDWMKKNGKIYTTYFLGEHVVFLDWGIYEKYLSKVEDAAELTPMWPPPMTKIFGQHSVLLMRAGRGPAGDVHRRLRAKLMKALAPRQVLMMAPRIEAGARRLLQACASQTAGSKGCVSMKEHIYMFAAENAAVAILGELGDDRALLAEIVGYFKLMEDAILALVPVDLPFLAFGRAMNARRIMSQKIRDLMKKASVETSQRNVLTQLIATDMDGQGLNEDEVVDTLVTVLFAGVLTTVPSIAHIIVNLSQNAHWAERIASEAQYAVDT